MKAWWKIGQYRRSRKQVHGQLQQQRILLQQGIAAQARIIEIEEKAELIKGYVRLRVWVMIRLQEKLLYQQVNTMVTIERVPVAGEVVRIRILPENTASILIMP
ncbi:hypothetical protein HB364_02060 [Pseudoflavitalea sp. X16]|uniref:hypothetical protein n=1 Tax=Paraflavitalea devenefica TaxID=2716334 RepID=UPI00141E345F|nr:hypothetical protein [Paraflavitalea devenefica]NII23846.1 hypothetical protein [Paraflavitalea devenefica]